MIKKKSIFILFLVCKICLAYTPPIGIPQPPAPFGADVMDYVGQQYNYSKDARGLQNYEIDSGTGLPYTHYIDQSDGSATDVDNPYGTEAKPRATIPWQASKYATDTSLYLDEGSVMLIKGGEYDFAAANTSVYCDGSADKPVFIRGFDSNNRATLANDVIYYYGQYAVLEYFQYNETFNKLHGYSYSTLYDAPDHFVLRNNIGIGDGLPELDNCYDCYSVISDLIVNNIVIYNNTIYDYGQWDTTENDSHAFSIRKYSQYIWVLGNTVYHLGGDMSQVGLESDRNTHHIYYGDNTCYQTRENAIDIKEATNIIISHNDFYLFGYSPSFEYPITMGNFDTYGVDSPTDIWIIFNDFHNCNNDGVNIDGATDVYIIGNLFRDFPDTDKGYESYGVNVAYVRGGENLYVVNNTFYNTDGGIHKQDDVDEHAEFCIYNNITDTLQRGVVGNYHHLWLEDASDDTKIITDYNLYYQSGGTESIVFDDVSYSLTTYVAATTNGDNSVAGDPLFVTPGSNFYLQAGSPAIDSAKVDGTIATIYSTFQTDYGISIKYDIDGNVLPDVDRSMGAYQGSEASTRYTLFMTGG